MLAASVAGWWGWKPVGAWLGKRLSSIQESRAVERGDTVALLTQQLRASREEAMQLRQELGEERELRMTFATDYAVLKERVEHLTKAIAEDKRDCHRAIRRLNQEIERMTNEIATLRQFHQPGPPLS